ncbi:MAG: autotransporter-associated beta strand repeat-containing protein, partial [Sphaerospermopsis kisseleviana]
FEFTLTPTGGTSLSLTNFTVGSRQTGSGPLLMTLLSSLDSYTTALATNGLTNDSTWRLIAPTVTASTQTNGAVTFRIYGSDGTGNPTSGTINWRIDDLNIYGSSISGTLVTNTAGGTATFGVSGSGSATYSGNVSISNSLSSATLTAGNGGQATFSGIISGAGSITKTGAGSATLSGASTFTGATTISAGTLELANSTGQAIGSTASVSVASGATLLISQSDQVNNSAAVSLSGGTIQRAGAVNEVFGNLTVSSASTLNYGTGAVGTVAFGTYTPSSLLAVQNFGEGNVLTFNSNLSAFLPSIYGGIFSSSEFSFDNGFTSNWNGSTFTITAIPEPSTYLAAAGLLALMIWPSRRRLIRDAKKVLGLTPPMRDRLASR